MQDSIKSDIRDCMFPAGTEDMHHAFKPNSWVVLIQLLTLLWQPAACPPTPLFFAQMD